MKSINKIILIICTLILFSIIFYVVKQPIKNNYTYPIDLVYLWVDGSDPVWFEKKEKTLKQYPTEHNYAKGIQRWRDNQELKYSLRSVSEYLPWINKIYIVTDNQIPTWLDTNNPKIKIIDHKEILPEEALPTFNSMAIETALHKIPNLSEHFIYANDDCFVNLPLEPDFFFDEKGNPIIYAQDMDNENLDFLYKQKPNDFWLNLWVKPFKLMSERFNTIQ